MKETLRRAAGIVAWKPGSDGPLFLLLKNAHHGTWGFAKGHLEPGESELEGAAREFEEETGLEAPPLVDGFRIETEHRHRREDRQILKVVAYFLAASSSSGEVKISAEHDAVLWADEAMARQTLQFDSLRRVITAAVQALGGSLPDE
ncbi:MAG: NUDIX domain-containing protein [Planctomycetes bacterium]|nr:NUDIX domain-containing protein [Planctomycetota bacterium]